MSATDEIRQFFATIFPDLGGYCLLLFGLPSKHSHWTQCITDDEISMIQQWALQEDVYVGAGLAPTDYGPKLRCPASDISAIPGLWLDVDYGETHKKKNVPPTQEDAESLIQSMGPPPTMIVHSGHGLHAWWGFKELWVLDSDEERSKAHALVAGWSRTLINKARSKKWTADNVGELARIMRIPGTWNRKKVPVETKVHSMSKYRWNPLDFEEYLDAEADQVMQSVGNLSWKFMLQLDADAPSEKFHLLIDSDPKFYGAWHHTRKMDSQSEYDLSLATLAMMAGWNAQEIVNLLIANRRKFGEELKLNHEWRGSDGQPTNYYKHTLSKAAQGKTQEERDVLIADFHEGKDFPESVKKDPAEMKAILSELINFENGGKVRFGKMIKYLTNPPGYHLEINGQMVDLGKVDTLDSQRKFRLCLMAAIDKRMTEEKPKKWRQISQLLLDICEEEVTTPEVQAREGMKIWIDQYLNDHPLVGESEWQDAFLRGQPFLKGNKAYFTTKGIARYLNGLLMEKWDVRELAIQLKSIGATSTVQSINNAKGHTTKSYWEYVL